MIGCESRDMKVQKAVKKIWNWCSTSDFSNPTWGKGLRLAYLTRYNHYLKFCTKIKTDRFHPKPWFPKTHHLYNNYLWHFCIKYKNFESEIRKNYKIVWIFQVSFVESFQKFRLNFMEISYKVYENLNSIVIILRKFVRNIG